MQMASRLAMAERAPQSEENCEDQAHAITDSSDQKMIRFRNAAGKKLSLKVPRRAQTWGGIAAEDATEPCEPEVGRQASLTRATSDTASTTDRDEEHEDHEEEEAGEMVVWPDTDSDVGDLAEYTPKTYNWKSTLSGASVASSEPPSPALSRGCNWEPSSPTYPQHFAVYTGPCMQPAMPSPARPASVVCAVPREAPAAAELTEPTVLNQKKNAKRCGTKAEQPTRGQTRRGAAGKGRHQTPAEGEITTVMIRNLPKRLNQQDFLNEIEGCGFKGKFDFCYLPRDFSSGRSKGYAFVNFGTAADAAAFTSMWHKSRRFGLKSREQALDVSAAHIQGYEANVKVAGSSSATEVRNPDFRRFVLDRNQPASKVQGQAHPDATAALEPRTASEIRAWTERSCAGPMSQKLLGTLPHQLPLASQRVPHTTQTVTADGMCQPVTIFQLLGSQLPSTNTWVDTCQSVSMPLPVRHWPGSR